LVVNPGIHISTREAFSNIKPAVSSFDYTYFIENEELDIDFLSRSLRNDFEDYVFNKYAEISEIKNQMISSCALFSSMSGTGSTVYGIFNNEDDARESASGFPDSYFKFISTI
jgi:4-diphosphocytidyl-2-C-methyl-D-erythritol kinase